MLVMSKDFDMEGFDVLFLCALCHGGRIFERRICAPFLNMDLIQRKLRFQTFCCDDSWTIFDVRKNQKGGLNTYPGQRVSI